MVASNRTHVTSLNTVLAGADLTEMHQNAVLTIHTLLKAAGWTVQASSDSVTADANDNVSTIADVVSALPGTAHTWIHYRTPSALGNVEIILDCTDNAGTPVEIDWFGSDDYNADGTITNRPTSVVVGNEWNRTNIDLIPSGSGVGAVKINTGRMDDGEVWMVISKDGTSDMETGLWVPSFVNGDVASDPFPYAFFYHNNAAGAFSRAGIGTATNWRSHHTDNSDIAGVEIVTPADFMNSWTNGASNGSGAVPVCYIDFVVNSGTQGRYIGRSQDQRTAPDNTLQGSVEDGDTDSIRRVVIDDMWFVVESSQLPILL